MTPRVFSFSKHDFGAGNRVFSFSYRVFGAEKRVLSPEMSGFFI